MHILNEHRESKDPPANSLPLFSTRYKSLFTFDHSPSITNLVIFIIFINAFFSNSFVSSSMQNGGVCRPPVFLGDTSGVAPFASLDFRFSFFDFRVSCFRSVAEEDRRFAEEELELVVVDPVAGVADLDQAALGDGLIARVVLGDGQKAFEAPEKEDRRGDIA